MTYRLVSEQQVTRYQRETYRITQQRLTTLWTRYDNDFQKGNQTDFNNEYTSILSGELCQWQNDFSLLFLCNTETRNFTRNNRKLSPLVYRILTQWGWFSCSTAHLHVTIFIVLILNNIHTYIYRMKTFRLYKYDILR